MPVHCKRLIIKKFLKKLVFLSGLFLILSNQAWAIVNDSKVYNFAVVPQQSASKLAKLWVPILQFLSSKSGVKLRFRTAPSIPEFERRLAKGEYEFTYMNPYHYTLFHESNGYEAFAKQRNKSITGIIVVRKDNPIQSLEGLQGGILAFPSPAAFAASVLPRAYLKKQDISIIPKYVSSHDSVYHAVAAGIYPAGGGIERTFKNLEPAVQEKLKVLWVTRPYTPHAFAASPKVAPQLIAALQKAMLEMSNDETGVTLLKMINFTGIETAINADWDDVRELNLHLLDIENLKK